MLLKGGKNKKYYYCTNYFKKNYTSHSIEKAKLEKMILEELKIDDITRKYLYEKVNAIYIINVNGYIGSSTSKEIEYAKKLGKEVMYLEPIK